MIIFYAPDIEQTLTLPESDSAHAVRVLRLQPGDDITVTDGNGRFLNCRINIAHPKKTQVEIVSVQERPPFWNGPLTLAVAPTKNMDRMEWMTEKLTEIGIDRIVPLLCARSERKEIKPDRLRKIAVAAMKQSLKGTLPEVTDIVPFKKFVAADTSAQKFIAYCGPEFRKETLAQVYDPRKEGGATLLIGPEGDFSPEEVNLAVESGFRPVSLGEARLRTETAAISGIDTIHILQQIN